MTRVAVDRTRQGYNSRRPGSDDNEVIVHPKVMIVGLGGLGGVLLELLARDERIGEIIVGGRDGARGAARCNLARVGAAAQGVTASIRFTSLDLADVDATAATFARESPDLIVSTASRQTWWLTELLPDAAREPLGRTGFGAWLPVHLALAIKFMEAVRSANYRGHTLVASFPDVVNVVLGRIGLAPTAGLGNLDEIVPKVRHLAAERLSVRPREVRVLLVAHHALEPFVFGTPARQPPPFWLRVEHAGENVTERVDGAALVFAPYPLPSGPSWHFLTAASAVRLIRALTTVDGGLVHVPGPLGLPGGYPVAVSRRGIRMLELPGFSTDEAIALNTASHAYDGIERIEGDGTVTFTAQATSTLRDTLGYNLARLGPADVHAAADDLIARFHEYARRHGVDVAAALAISRLTA